MLIRVLFENDFTNGIFTKDEWIDANVKIWEGSLNIDDDILFDVYYGWTVHNYFPPIREKFLEFKNPEDKENLINKFKKELLVKDIID
jgi:hypothetical protein